MLGATFVHGGRFRGGLLSLVLAGAAGCCLFPPAAPSNDLLQNPATVHEFFRGMLLAGETVRAWNALGPNARNPATGGISREEFVAVFDYCRARKFAAEELQYEYLAPPGGDPGLRVTCPPAALDERLTYVRIGQRWALEARPGQIRDMIRAIHAYLTR